MMDDLQGMIKSEGLGMGQQQDQDGNLDNVCRDFLRNVCRRGSSCRYAHPDSVDAEELGKKIEYVFCHDYQNRECRRQNCRFLHCTKQEGEIYQQTGKMPQHVLDKMAQNKANEQLGGGPSQGESVPICKDFLKGECRRGAGRCKFRHISQAEADMEMRGGGGHGPGMGMGHMSNGSNNHPIGPQSMGMHGPAGGMGGPAYGMGPGAPRNPYAAPGRPAAYPERGPYDNPYAPPEAKRRALEQPGAYGAAAVYPYGDASRATVGLPGAMSNDAVSAAYDPYQGAGAAAATAQIAASALQSQTLYNNTRYLEEENTALRRRIEELKKQVADLMATNEFLLEQNAQLRNLAKGAGQGLPPGPGQGGQQASQSNNDVGGLQLTMSRPDGVPVAVSLASLTAAGLPISSIAAALSTSGMNVSTSSVSQSGQLQSSMVSYPIMASAAMTQSVSDRLAISHSLQQH